MFFDKSIIHEKTPGIFDVCRFVFYMQNNIKLKTTKHSINIIRTKTYACKNQQF